MSVLYGESAEQLRVLLEDPVLSPAVDSDWASLPAVHAGGCVNRPRVALVFINPTYRNQSAREGWATDRAPFIGLRRIWSFLASCGYLSDDLVAQLPRDGHWQPRDAALLYQAVAEAGIYVTNLVKACRMDSAMPTSKQAQQWLPLLERELELVEPQVVVGMGTLVSSLLAGEPVRMGDFADRMAESNSPASLRVSGRRFDVVPCYFPVGRGNPAKARDIMRVLNAHMSAMPALR